MAQFDVHRNKGPLKDSIPFVVHSYSDAQLHCDRLVIETAGGRRAWAAGDVVHVRPPATNGPDLA